MFTAVGQRHRYNPKETQFCWPTTIQWENSFVHKIIQNVPDIDKAI